MTTIHEIGTPFAFDSIQLDEPVGIQGGAYVSKIRMKTSLIQTPMLMIKTGIVVNDKKGYIDCMWDTRTSDGRTMTEFIETFENTMKTLIYQYREQWFDGDIDEEDIQYFFQSSIKTYQSKFNVMRILLSRLSKTMLRDLSGGTQCQEYGVLLYNEDEQLLDFDDLRENCVQQPAIFMVEPHCVKFTSTSFQVDYHLRQIMILKRPDEAIRPVLQQCLIHHTKKKETSDTSTYKEPNELKHYEEVKNHPIVTPIETHVEEKTEKSNDSFISVESNKAVTQIEQVEEHTPRTQETGRKTPQLMNVDLEFPEDDAPISLKHPNQVYYELYNEARQRAQKARQEAMDAYLEAKHIRETFHLTVDDELEKEMNTYSIQS